MGFVLASCALLATTGQAQSADRERMGQFEGLVSELETLGPREENSQSEKAAFSIITRTLESAGLRISVSNFEEARSGYSASRIVDASIPGDRAEELVFVAPVNSWYDAADGKGGAAGIALALSAATRLAKADRKPPLTLRFVFLGAERRGRSVDGEEASLGTRTWIASLPSSPSRSIIYLSLDSDASAIAVRNAGHGVLSPLWHYDRTRSSLKAAGIPAVLEVNRLLLYRQGLADRYGPAAPYLEARISAVELRSMSTGAGPIDGARYDSLVDALVAANAEGFPTAWDLHYLIFQVGAFSATVRETAFVGFIVFFCATAALCILSLSITRRAAAKALLARVPFLLWQAFALYAALVAVFLAGILIARFDALALGSRDAWRIAPRLFGTARIVSSMLLFLALISLFVERKTLTSNPYFYEFVALVCLGVDVFAFSAVNLPMSFNFLWAFAFVGASLAARRGWATIAAYGLMYAPIILVAADLAAKPEYLVFERIIEPGVAGSLALAALTLPFFAFTASPLLFYAPHGALARKRTAALLALVALAAEGGALVITSFSRSSSSSISVSESLDQGNNMFETVLKGQRRLGSGKLLRGGEELHYASLGDQYTIAGVDATKRISWSSTSSFFLDRRTEKLRIDFASPPFTLDIRLKGSGDLGIYDCDLPYRVSLDGKSADIFLPVNPGRSVAFEITVPRDFAAELDIAAEYLDPPVPYVFSDGTIPLPGRFTLRAVMSLN